MKAKLIILLLSLTVVLPIEAQHKRFNNSSQKVKNKIEELENIKLIEILDLKEEDMLKFFNRRKEFLERNRQLEENKNKHIDELRTELNDLDEQKGKTAIDEIILLEENILKNKRDFIFSLKDILSNKQIVKLIIFERNFKKELKELLLKKRSN